MVAERNSGNLKKVFLAWKPFCTRSHNQAKHFDAKEIYIFPFKSGNSLARLLGRYWVSFWITLRVLHAEKADVVFVLNQPPPLLFAVFLYSRVFKGDYILDSHSAAFNDRKWAWFRPMYRFIASRALLNINTNARHKALVESWGGRSYVISDVPIDHAMTYAPVETPGLSVMVVASFMFDEPLEEVWEAARQVPEVVFYVTGDHNKADRRLIENIPQNVVLTGFMPIGEYFGLMVSVKAVMVLTTRDDTMQMGAYEALSLAQPIITSDWEVLRNSFGDGAVYVKNTPESIAEGVRQLMMKHEEYTRAIAGQRQARRAYFERVRSDILEDLDHHSRPWSSTRITR
jgi:glycosyltransferase involved in cell wall biosynthesis